MGRNPSLAAKACLARELCLAQHQSGFGRRADAGAGRLSGQAGGSARPAPAVTPRTDAAALGRPEREGSNPRVPIGQAPSFRGRAAKLPGFHPAGSHEPRHFVPSRADGDPLLDPATLLAARVCASASSALCSALPSVMPWPRLPFRRQVLSAPVGDMIGAAPLIARGVGRTTRHGALLAESLLEYNGFDLAIRYRVRTLAAGRLFCPAPASVSGSVQARRARLPSRSGDESCSQDHLTRNCLDPERSRGVAPIRALLSGVPGDDSSAAADASRTTCQAPSAGRLAANWARIERRVCRVSQRAASLPALSDHEEAAHTNTTAAAALAAPSGHSARRTIFAMRAARRKRRWATRT